MEEGEEEEELGPKKVEREAGVLAQERERPRAGCPTLNSMGVGWRSLSKVMQNCFRQQLPHAMICMCLQHMHALNHALV